MPDHIAKAMEALAVLEHPNANTDIQDRALMRALIHATLAQAEQMKIANLLTITRMHTNPLDGSEIELRWTASQALAQQLLGTSDDEDELLAEFMADRRRLGLDS